MLSILRTVRREVLLLFGVSFIVLIAVQAFAYSSLISSEEAKAQLRRSKNISQRIESLVSDIKDVETAVRGYALAGNESYLVPYDEAMPRIKHHIQEMDALILDSVAREAFERLTTLAEERVAIGQNVIDTQRQQGIMSARDLIESGSGKRAMDALRNQADIMLLQEDKLAAVAEEKANTATRFTRILFIVGFIVIICLQGLAFYLVLSEIQTRQLAERAVKELNSQLEAHVTELDSEIEDRKAAEARAKELNDQLEEQLGLLNESNNALNAVNRELESFAYSVSHDLRSPLRGLDGLSLALMEDYGDKLDEIGMSFLTRMRSESQRMGQLIDGVLSLSRLTRGDIHKERVNLSNLAKSYLQELQGQEPGRNVEIKVQDNVVVKADPRLIEAVMQNLLDNAWKFTSKHAEAHIEFGTLQESDKTVYFIKDDGAGFDMSYKDKLFGTFQRLHGMQEFPGTGIGLASIQRIIHRHGGKVWAEGELEKGATFYFTLS